MHNDIKQQYKKIIAKLEVQYNKLTWQNRAILLLFILVLVYLISFGVYSFIDWSKNSKNNQESIISETKDENAENKDNTPGDYVRRRIDGVYVKSENANNYPIAVMIDNDPAARLQSGLAYAQVVYEAKAESGITRFLAIFTDGEESKEIGPVRSARPYYVDWARGYDALYVHVGGSPEALSILKNVNMLNLNEFYQGNYFWRSNNKAAPHNVYSSIENFKKYLDKLNADNDSYNSWKYKDEAAEDNRGEQNIEINFSVNDYLVDWEYGKEENNYSRYMAGAQHKDADGTPIIAKNIIIMQMKSEILDEELRRKMYDIGGGKAWYCFDGKCETGKWKKENSDTREIIYDNNGNEIEFNAGTTWIEIVQYGGEISITN
ncbi:MAG: DUF3048 domain-containing protein [Patescibacteria group bacterium]|jgi:hypothetical protein